MKKLSEDLKNGKFKNVYLLYGSQAYLRNQYRDRIVSLLLPGGDRLNYTCYQGEKVQIAEIIDLAETMPFMGEHRVIVLENTGFFESANDELAEYISNVPDTTFIIFSEEKVNKSFKLYKAVDRLGGATCFDTVTTNDIKAWVLKKIRDEHKNIEGAALALFLERIGTDMLAVSAELNKLLSYTYKKDTISYDDVAIICTEKFEDKVFELMDSILAGDMNKTLALYGDMLALQKDLAGILGFMENQLRMLFNCRMFIDEGTNSAEKIAAKLKMNEYRVKKALPQARKSSRIWLKNSLEACVKLDEDFKRGKINIQVGLELLICQMVTTI